MRLLLDTHVLLWWLGKLPRLGPAAQAAIDDPTSEVFVSAVVVAEISVKKVIGKLNAPDDLPEQIVNNGFTALPLSVRHGHGLAELPRHHGDPFDRLLIAQARIEDLTFVTADRAMSAYDVTLMSATT